MSMEKPTILFLTNSELGQASISLAVAHEFLTRPSYTVHIASFANLEPAVDALNARAKTLASATTTATFHPISGPCMKDAFPGDTESIDYFNFHPIGFWGARRQVTNLVSTTLIPWDGPQYVAIYNDCVQIIKKTQPVIVVLDPFFYVAVDACRMLHWPYVALSPNTVKDIVPQPKLASLWKYPALFSGYAYPMPWRLVPFNIYLTVKVGWALMKSKQSKELKEYRNTHGLMGPNPSVNISPGDKIPFLLPTRPETDFPCFIPDNFTLCGPIVRPCNPISEECPELAAWLLLRPTVLVNMGSHVKYNPAQERQFAEGFRMLMDRRKDIQILWKLQRTGEKVEPTALDSLRPAIEQGRVRIESWLAVDPICVLLSGQVQCMVHHGGANSYHEAVRAGVPQVVLPLWFDTYDFAHRAEFCGIGVWGSRQSAPAVQSGELGRALIRVLASDESLAMAERARRVAAQLGKEGRVVACEKIIDLIQEKK